VTRYPAGVGLDRVLLEVAWRSTYRSSQDSRGSRVTTGQVGRSAFGRKAKRRRAVLVPVLVYIVSTDTFRLRRRPALPRVPLFRPERTGVYVKIPSTRDRSGAGGRRRRERGDTGESLIRSVSRGKGERNFDTKVRDDRAGAIGRRGIPAAKASHADRLRSSARSRFRLFVNLSPSTRDARARARHRYAAGCSRSKEDSRARNALRVLVPAGYAVTTRRVAQSRGFHVHRQIITVPDMPAGPSRAGDRVIKPSLHDTRDEHADASRAGAFPLAGDANYTPWRLNK